MKTTSTKQNYTFRPPRVKAETRFEVMAQIARFPKRFQSDMADFAAEGREAADLILGYPAFAFALATRFGDEGDSETILEMLKAGERSKQLADLYGLPRWLRKLPPEAFVCLFPQGLSRSDDFNRQMMGIVPTETNIAPHWFFWVMHVWCLTSEDFTLWLAKQPIFGRFYKGDFQAQKLPCPDLLAPLMLYAWYCAQGLTEAMDVKWTKNIKFHNALQGAGDWINQCNMPNLYGLHHYYQKEMENKSVRQRQKPWIDKSVFEGYSFEPLTDYDALRDEGSVMEHCVLDYARFIERDLCCVFSIKDKKKPVATLELARSKADGYKAEIVQIQGRNNAKPALDVIEQCHSWLRFNQRRNKVKVCPLPDYENRKQAFHIDLEAYWYGQKNIKRHVQERWQKVSFLEEALMRLHTMTKTKKS